MPIQTSSTLGYFALLLLLCAFAPLLRGQGVQGTLAPAHETVADILEALGPRPDAVEREAAIVAIRRLNQVRRQEAIERALALNLPVRFERVDGVVKEVTALDDAGDLLYYFTHNDRAAISTGANILNQLASPYTGAGVTIGMWDGGSGRTSHQEFAGGRMVNKDGAAPIDHATHVGGTLAAAGVVARARGMAFEAVVDSYDWNDDKAEMAERGASAPGQAGAIYLSNHSYGFITGWYRTGGSNPAFVWYGSGSGANAVDPRFGQYNTAARDSDALAYNAPYYLMFWSAGNDGTDNPSAGQSVRLSPSSTETVTYDPSVHPAGDGVYRNGYATIGFDGVAKNVLTVGSVSDAVTNGLRDPSVALVSNFSSRGPTDDGRIKPDLVANGESLYSTRNGDTSYGNLSGTSMSAPNATGSAALLVEKYARLFSGGAMRSSTLKALLIHTADDLGTPGPDYRYGWGLLNAAAAADLLRDHAGDSGKLRLLEEKITPGDSTLVYEFVWDGESPIRATLVWTDPAGAATTSTDLRSPRLRNNLDLRIVGPDNQSFFPYVMPFVGTWTVESMSAPATTGINNTDNVEQVYIESPPGAGTYRLIVSYQGTLTNNEQYFSLLLDGDSGEVPPPPPLTLVSISPEAAFADSKITLRASGLALSTATELKLVRSDQPEIVATNLRMTGDELLADLDLTGAVAGVWDVQVSNHELVSPLSGAFTVIGAIWSENFDNVVSGWSSTVLNGVGSNQWSLVTNASHTPPASYFAPGPATRSTTALVSPSISISSEATDLQLRFWHQYNLENRRDGGRLEFRINGGSWTGIDESGSGAAFASNGYTGSIQGTGNPNLRSTFVGKNAWTGNSGGFIETVVNLFDTAKFSGKQIQFRWTLATDNSNASSGWHVDSIVLLGGGDLVNQPPQIDTPLDVIGAEIIVENAGTLDERILFGVREAFAEMTVSASDDGGAANLTFTWSASGPETVFFIPNATAESFRSEAFFEAPGDYTVTVTVTDSGGLSTSDSALVRVIPSQTVLRITPSSVSLRVGEQLTFTAEVLDQFNQPMAEQPESYNWSTNGGGTITDDGIFHATEAGENFTVSANSGTMESSVVFGAMALFSTANEELSDVAQVTVFPATAQVTLSNLEVEYDGTPRSVTVSTDPPDLAVEVTYNGSSELPVRAGTYAVEATVIDPNYEGSATASFVIMSNDLAEFDDWTAEYELTGDDAKPDSDPDGDGMSNWLEWLFGFDPTDPNSRLKAWLSYDGTQFQLMINRVISQGTFIIETSNTLIDWEEAARLDIDADEDDYEHSIDTDLAERLFIRVRYILENE
jgi:hypothetical protein